METCKFWQISDCLVSASVGLLAIARASMCMHALGINSQFCLGDQFWQAYVCQIWSPKGTIFGKGGLILAVKTGPRDRFWQSKLVRGTDFGSQNWYGGTNLAIFFVKIGPGDQFWGGPILA